MNDFIREIERKAIQAQLYVIFDRQKEEAININKLLRTAQDQINSDIVSIPTIFGNLFHIIMTSEPELLWDHSIASIVYTNLEDIYQNNEDNFLSNIGKIFSLWYIGVKSYLGVADTIREFEALDYLPEVKTRLYRIPVYSMLLESVIGNMLKSIRNIESIKTGGNYSSLKDLGKLKDLLSAKGYSKLFDYIDVDVRNAINHGGIIIKRDEITFVFFRGSQRTRKEKAWTFAGSISEMINIRAEAKKPHFDDFIEGAFDTAGGIIIGFLRLFAHHKKLQDKIMDEAITNNSILFEWLEQYLSFPRMTCISIDEGLVGEPQINFHFYTKETNHGKLLQFALTVALIARDLIPKYDNYMVGFNATRMNAGWTLLKGNELDMVLAGNIQPDDLALEVIRENSRVVFFEASDEDVDLEYIRRFRFSKLDGSNWSIRDIYDCSTENTKRLGANLYIYSNDNRERIVESVKDAVVELKSVENPPSPKNRIKHGKILADALYFQVFKNIGRRRERIINANNTNLICVIEWRNPTVDALRCGGLPEDIWNSLELENVGDILFAWNPTF